MSQYNNFSNKRIYYNNNKRIKKVKIPSDRRITLMGPGRFCPDRTFATLRWPDTTTTRAPPGSSTSMNWYYRSSAYDPDPAFGSGAIPGFVELANMYLSYRVHKMVLHLSIANEEPKGIIVSVIPSNELHNVNSLSASDILEYGANVNAEKFLLSNANGGLTNKTVTVAAEGIALVGPQYRTALEYTGSTSGNPAIMFYINVGIVECQQNFTFQPDICATIDYHIEFFDRRTLES